MDVGIAFANTGPFADAGGVVELATAAEAAGFDSLWTVEHVIWPDAYSSEYPYSPTGKMPGDASSPIPDPLIWLSFAGAHTVSIKLATGIVILPQRNPAVLAKACATLAQLSNDRFLLGIGVGWLEEEFDALGVPWAKRGARTDEYIEAMRALWASDDASYQGQFTSFSGVSSNPKPPSGAVPIVVGGDSPAAARRAGRLGNGYFPAKGNVSDVATKVDIVRQSAADANRDPMSIEITGFHPGLLGEDPVGAAQEFAAIGVSRIIVPGFALAKGNVSENAMALSERIVGPLQAVTG